MMRRGSAAAALCAAAALTAAGCRGPQRAGPGYEILETMPAEATLAAAQIYPTASGRLEYRITQGDDAGALLVERRLATPGPCVTWIDDPRGGRREFWRVDGAGDIVMPAVVDEGDGAITLFDPPLILAHAQLAPGPPRTQRTLMQVVRLDDPSRPRESGTASQTFEYSDQVRLRTAGGELTAARVTITFKADLRMADAETVTTLYVVPGPGPGPGPGPVVREWSEAVKALGVTIRRGRRSMVAPPS